ncbi:MAG: mercury resistance protein [Gammaproteobacteria bacterium]|nr:mercury resistance protein [Gammaproteobacteria bacterium]
MIRSDELILTHDSAAARRRRWSRALGFLALITCPCHVPLLALALSGTAAGALLTAHFDAALMLFTAAFLLSLCAAIWVWRGKGIDGP